MQEDLSVYPKLPSEAILSEPKVIFASEIEPDVQAAIEAALEAYADDITSDYLAVVKEMGEP